MIEEIVLNYLNSKLGVPAYAEKPEEKPARYVLIEKTGGSEEDMICSATLAIQSYAESLYQAVLLNKQVKTAMRSIVNLPEIGRSQLNSDYNFTDTTTKEYRYQAVFDLIY